MVWHLEALLEHMRDGGWVAFFALFDLFCCFHHQVKAFRGMGHFQGEG